MLRQLNPVFHHHKFRQINLVEDQLTNAWSSYLVQQPVGFTRGPPEVQAGLEGMGRHQHTVRLLAGSSFLQYYSH